MPRSSPEPSSAAPVASRGSLARKLKRAGLVTGGGLAALIVVGAAATAIRERRTFPTPPVDLHASSDPAIIARGRYLVRGPAHCAECHGDPARAVERAAGAEVALSGGTEFHLPVGVFRVPNITPDPTTGIGRLSDPDVARLLRYGVRPDGSGVLPFMPFANLADDDVVAILSYLRAQPAVRHAVAPHHFNPLGHIVKAFVLSPRGPAAAVPPAMPPQPTAAYGRYLAHDVANCVGCHTRVDMRTGAFAGPLFGGGAVIESSTMPGRSFVTPNLTPDPRWGWIASWPEEVFVARVRQGQQRPGSPMPWNAFKTMTDDDLHAIFRYLRTVKPVAGGPDPSRPEAVVAEAERR